MSKNKAKPESKIRLLKLVSGNTVLGNVLRINDLYEISQPMEVLVIPDQSRQRTTITFMDFIPASVSEKVYIHRDHVICTANAAKDVLELYDKVTNPSTVVQPPEKQLLLP